MPPTVAILRTLAFGCAALLTGPAFATTGPIDADPPAGTREAVIDGRSLGGFVLPILPVSHDLRMEAQRTVEWTVDETKRLLLQGDVEVELGTYDFRADLAVIWINRLPSDRGLVNQVAIWFSSVSEPTRRAGLGATQTLMLGLL